MAQKQALEDDATATQRKMDSANALLSALAGEEGRWTQQSKEFDDTIQKLTGMGIPIARASVLMLAAACMVAVAQSKSHIMYRQAVIGTLCAWAACAANFLLHLLRCTYHIGLPRCVWNIGTV